MNSTGANYSSCAGSDSATLFLQFGCHFTTDELNTRQVEGLYIGCIGVFTALFFVVFIDYTSSVFKNSFVEWDVKTITAGDYTCELTISQGMWDTFCNDIYNNLGGKTKIASFRDYIQNELEERLTRLPDLGYEDPPPDRIKIAMISFAFDNSELINLLRSRGQAIKFEKYDKMREINKKIDDLKSDPITLTKLNRPVTAFLSFENEEGINRCKEYNEAVTNDPQFSDIKTFLGEEMEIEDASEPTDIIWENRHFTYGQRLKRAIIVIFIVCILLMISFVIIFLFSKESASLSFKYSSSYDCEETYSDYNDNEAILEKLAFQEYFNNRIAPDYTSEKSSTDYGAYLQCFCKKRSKEGDGWSQEYNNTLTNLGVTG